MPSNITHDNNNNNSNNNSNNQEVYTLKTGRFNLPEIKHLIEYLGKHPDKIIYGKDPLIFQCSNNTEILNYLISCGANVNIRDTRNNSTFIIHTTEINSTLQTLQLIGAGADVNHITNGGTTAIQRAAHNGNLHNIRAIIKAGGDPYLGKSSDTFRSMKSYMENSSGISKCVLDALQEYKVNLKESDKSMNKKYDKMVYEDVDAFLSNMKLVVQI